MNEQEKQSNNDRNIGIFVIVLVFFGIFVYLFGRGSFGGGSAGNDNELKTIISEQGQRLTEFETNLQLLEQSSPDLIVTLNELRVSHDRMQKRLEAAEKYSNEAKLLISEQNRSLQKLSEQIKHQQKVQRRREIQDKGWGFAAGIVTAKLVEKIS